MAPEVALVSSATSSVVGLVAALLVVLAVRARRRSGNPQLAYVAGAFGVFVARSAFSAYNVQTHAVPHDEIELVLSLLDLLILILLCIPFVLRGQGSR